RRKAVEREQVGAFVGRRKERPVIARPVVLADKGRHIGDVVGCRFGGHPRSGASLTRRRWLRPLSARPRPRPARPRRRALRTGGRCRFGPPRRWTSNRGKDPPPR